MKVSRKKVIFIITNLNFVVVAKIVVIKELCNILPSLVVIQFFANSDIAMKILQNELYNS